MKPYLEIDRPTVELTDRTVDWANRLEAAFSQALIAQLSKSGGSPDLAADEYRTAREVVQEVHAEASPLQIVILFKSIGRNAPECVRQRLQHFIGHVFTQIELPSACARLKAFGTN